MAKGDVAFVVTIPADFRAPRRARRQPADPDRGRRHRSGGGERRHLDAGHAWPAGAAARAGHAGGGRRERATGQLEVVVHRRYNPEGISQYNIVPGLLGVILQMTMVMMTSIALTRETERGTMENLLAMPATPGRNHARQDAALSGRRRACRWWWCWSRRSCCSRVPFVGLAVAAARRRSSSSSWRWCCSATPSRPSRARRCRRCS